MGLLTLNELSGLGDAWVVLPNGSRLKLPRRDPRTQGSVRGVWSRRGISDAARSAEGDTFREQQWFMSEFKRAWAHGEDSPAFHRFLWEWDPKRRRTDPGYAGHAREAVRALVDPDYEVPSARGVPAWRPTQVDLDRMIRLHRAARQKELDAEARRESAAREASLAAYRARVAAARRAGGYVGISPEEAKRQREEMIARNVRISERLISERLRLERERLKREREDAAFWAERRRAHARADARTAAALREERGDAEFWAERRRATALRSAREAEALRAAREARIAATTPIYGPPAPLTPPRLYTPTFAPPAAAPRTAPATQAASGTLVSTLQSAPFPQVYYSGAMR
jgi:hypothetical protein